MINEIKTLIEQGVEFCHKKRRYYLYKTGEEEYMILKFNEKDAELTRIPEEKFDNADIAIKRWIELVNLAPSIPEKKKKK